MKIRRVYSNVTGFRGGNFDDGLNVILADRTHESTKTDSRNGLGKTTFIEVIHFCLGSRLAKDQRLWPLSKSEWVFSLDLEIEGKVFTVSRSMEDTSRVRLSGDLPPSLSFDLSPDIMGEYIISLREWTRILGRACFGLDPSDTEPAYAPSYRAVIQFFARVGPPAYLSPFEVRKAQRTWQTQLYNAFLLRLNWRQAGEWQALRDRRRLVDAVASQPDSGDVGVAALGELEAERVQIQSRVNRLKEQLESFTVLPEYRSVETRVNELTVAMQEATNSNTFDRRLRDLYQRRMKEEHTDDTRRIVDVFEEARVQLGEAVRRELSEVLAFHRQVTSNRRDYLSSEIRRLSRAIEARSHEIEQFDRERQEALILLRTTGALEDFMELQRRLGEATADLASIARRTEQARALRTGRADIKVNQDRLHQQALIDLDERRENWSAAVSHFAANSDALYGAPGALIIDVGPSGFTFRTELRRANSEGVGKMAIFCYDLALSQTWSRQQDHPGFLIHDSTVYDGVDERQISQALSLANEQSEALGFQYIVCLNSDNIPPDIRDLVEDHVRIRLTDADESGSLLGRRFA